jgi:hypothetical protein
VIYVDNELSGGVISGGLRGRRSRQRQLNILQSFLETRRSRHSIFHRVKSLFEMVELVGSLPADVVELVGNFLSGLIELSASILAEAVELVGDFLFGLCPDVLDCSLQVLYGDIRGICGVDLVDGSSSTRVRGRRSR